MSGFRRLFGRNTTGEFETETRESFSMDQHEGPPAFLRPNSSITDTDFLQKGLGKSPPADESLYSMSAPALSVVAEEELLIEDEVPAVSTSKPGAFSEVRSGYPSAKLADHDAIKKCRDTLRLCGSIDLLKYSAWLKNTQLDFDYWLSYAKMSAQHSGGPDYLSAEASEADGMAASVIVDLLDLLAQLLYDCALAGKLASPDLLSVADHQAGEEASARMAPRQAEHLSQAGKGSGFENLKSRIAQVDTVLQQLSNLVTSLRRTPKLWDKSRADDTFDADEHQKLRSHLTTLLLTRNNSLLTRLRSEQLENTARETTNQPFPSFPNYIQCRLINANLRRRHRFSYARRYGGSLNHTRTVWDEPERIAQTSKSGSGDLPDRLSLLFSENLFPNPPFLPADSRNQLCPYCWLLLPRGIFENEESWRHHLIQDMSPYICILEYCSDPDRMYKSYNEWYLHLQKIHRATWECFLCGMSSLDGREGTADHFQKIHAMDHTKSASLIDFCKKAAQPDILSCPLCSLPDEEGPLIVSRDLIQHIAEHQLDFALRALPWETQTQGRPKRCLRRSPSGLRQQVHDWRVTIIDDEEGDRAAKRKSIVLPPGRAEQRNRILDGSTWVNRDPYRRVRDFIKVTSHDTRDDSSADSEDAHSIFMDEEYMSTESHAYSTEPRVDDNLLPPWHDHHRRASDRQQLYELP